MESMHITPLTSFILTALTLACGTPESASEAAGDDRLGRVELAASCGFAADSALERGLALLHHMTYEPAEAAFAQAVAADSGCALGYWGQAMTYIHPLWSDPPETARFDRGASLVARARLIDDLSDHERAYVEAVGAYYDAGRRNVERPNLEAFAAGWEAAYTSYPDDLEITAFHALSLLGIADPGDKTYEVQRRAGSLAATVLAEHPGHPGGHHYTIHAYDYPPLAEQAVPVARSYAEIAPSVPHALHMPTHIFTRLGMWDASIDLNDRSARAAREHPVDGAISLHFFHALDYVAYAHLQRAEWEQAQAVLDTLREVDGRLMVELATPYTLAAVPARVALERGAWSTAAALPVRVPADYPWDDFPAVEAITHFARGIGAARAGDPEAARASADRLAELRDAAGRTSAYWATQVEVQRLAVEAWTAHAAGDEDTGLGLMREAAELEATTEKHPVTPGEIVPATELLGEMLLELERYREAGEAFGAALERSPRRLRSLYGAGRAAELAGDTATAAERYDELLELTESGDQDTEAIRHAREFVSNA
jgi:tetratricopeptide (TPR) repeat protein